MIGNHDSRKTSGNWETHKFDAFCSMFNADSLDYIICFLDL